MGDIGIVVGRSMRKEALTEEELMSHFQEQGVENMREVKRAYLEDDGQISVIKRQDGYQASCHGARRCI